MRHVHIHLYFICKQKKKEPFLLQFVLSLTLYTISDVNLRHSRKISAIPQHFQILKLFFFKNLKSLHCLIGCPFRRLHQIFNQLRCIFAVASFLISSITLHIGFTLVYNHSLSYYAIFNLSSSFISSIERSVTRAIFS